MFCGSKMREVLLGHPVRLETWSANTKLMTDARLQYGMENSRFVAYKIPVTVDKMIVWKV